MRNRVGGAIFWGLLLIGIGAFWILRNAGVSFFAELPVAATIFLILCVGALVSWIWQRQWGWLIPACTFAGISFLLFNTHYGWLAGAIGAGILVGLIGFPFLLRFLAHPSEWWMLIPGGLLAFVGLSVALSVSVAGSYLPAIVLWGIGLSFLLTFLARREHWWALIPAGILVAIGMIPPAVGPWGLDSVGWIGTIVCGGFMLSFGAVALVGRGAETRWALYPFAFFLVMAICFLIFGELAAQWWPLLLVILGVWILLANLVRRGRRLSPF